MITYEPNKDDSLEFYGFSRSQELDNGDYHYALYLFCFLTLKW